MEQGWIYLFFAFPMVCTVRQGGILSPKLFAPYLSSLSRFLAMSNVGCYIDDLQCMNHLMYDDDMCILASTAIAIQQLLDICIDYGVANDITLNYYIHLYY